MAVKVELPKGTPLSEVDKEVKVVENILHTNAGIEAYTATFGSSFTPTADDVFDQGGGFIQQPNVANLSIQLKDKKSVNAYIASLQADLDKVSNHAAITVTNKNIAGDDSTIKIMLIGADQLTLEKAAEQARMKLVNIQGLSVTGQTDLTNGNIKYEIAIDKNKALAAGIDPDEINKLLLRYTSKAKDFDISSSTGTDTIPVDVYIDSVKKGIVTAQSVPMYSPEQVLASLAAEIVKGNDGKAYHLDNFVTMQKSDALSSIQERDGQPFSVVQAQITSSNMSKVSKEVDKTLKAMQLPDGVSI
ncbi:efflux RND transporter permease subunit [Paenibacillus sp. YAF4_2]